jgi:hypothetical protein
MWVPPMHNLLDLGRKKAYDNMTIVNLLSNSKLLLKMLRETGAVQISSYILKSPDGYITVARLHTGSSVAAATCSRAVLFNLCLFYFYLQISSRNTNLHRSHQVLMILVPNGLRAVPPPAPAKSTISSLGGY